MQYLKEDRTWRRYHKHDERVRMHDDDELLVMQSKGQYLTPEEKERARLYALKKRKKKLKK